MRFRLSCVAIVAALIATACASASETVEPATATAEPPPTTTSSTEASPTTSEPLVPPTTAADSTTAVPLTGSAPPEWLGTRELPLRPGETNGLAQPTPPELIDRQLWTVDLLPPPLDDTFVQEVTVPAPADVIARSTWNESCPIAAEDLAWVTVSFFGFDHRFHTGELLVHRTHAEPIADVFRQLHDMRFPIEEMRVTTRADLDAPPTGDSNNTASFVCRPAVNSTSWSQHALGAAVDINPFHNPYVKEDLVLPELASAYLDRDRFARGMIHADVVAAFEAIGWGWGGNWNSALDWMHFSSSGG